MDSTTGTGKDSRARTGSSIYDWDRLERAVGALVEQNDALRTRIRALTLELGERDSRIRGLETQLLQANQRRSDAYKRIDELIAQLDELDAQLDHVDPNS